MHRAIAALLCQTLQTRLDAVAQERLLTLDGLDNSALFLVPLPEFIEGNQGPTQRHKGTQQLRGAIDNLDVNVHLGSLLSNPLGLQSRLHFGRLCLGDLPPDGRVGALPNVDFLAETLSIGEHHAVAGNQFCKRNLRGFHQNPSLESDNNRPALANCDGLVLVGQSTVGGTGVAGNGDSFVAVVQCKP